MLARLVLIATILALYCISSSSGAPSTRVVGGTDANIGQFPHQVSLQREDGSQACGGSIISQNFILTAAHCVVVGNGIEPYPAKYFQVRVGSIQRTAGGQLLQLKRIIVNKTYGNFLNDLALLELEQPLTFTSNIQAIELANEEVPVGSDVIISGWGRLSTNGAIPHRMQWNTLKALNTDQCEDEIGMGHDSLICLAHPPNNGACYGDSGGPATYNGKLVGVAGFVVNDCGSQNPDGYAKVAFHRDWIKATTGE